MPRHAPIRPARELKSDADDATRSPADVVDELASELNLLSESHTNPDAFLERRDMITKRLRRLARQLRGITPRREHCQRAPRTASHSERRAALNEAAAVAAVREAHALVRSRPVLSLKGSHATRD